MSRAGLEERWVEGIAQYLYPFILSHLAKKRIKWRDLTEQQRQVVRGIAKNILRLQEQIG